MTLMMSDTTSRPRLPRSTAVDLAVDFAGLALRNPVMLAAGTCGYVDEIAEVVDVSKLGGLVTKSITVEPREGNQPLRIMPLAAGGGMINAIGLANMGLQRFLAEKAPRAAALPTCVIASIAGHAIEEYVRLGEAIEASGAFPALELNVSCPNVAHGLVFGEDPGLLGRLLDAVRPVLARTRLIVKLSPNAPSIVQMAAAAVDHGADALSLINTFTGLVLDVETRRPRLANVTGGVSGPAIHPIAVRMVHDVYRRVARDRGIPILAYGGVQHWQDAAEFILVGASAVGLGTANFVNPGASPRIVNGLARWARRQGAGSIRELVGRAEIG